MDTLIEIITDPAVLTGIATLVTALLPMFGVPMATAALIGSAATTAVKAVEQTKSGATSAQKKQAAVDLVKAGLPIAVRLLPSTKRRIDAAIEANVNTMNKAGKHAEPVKTRRRKD